MDTRPKHHSVVAWGHRNWASGVLRTGASSHLAREQTRKTVPDQLG